MGDAADDAFDRYIESEFFSYQAPSDYQDAGDFLWIDKQGRVHDMHNMSFAYLDNCLKICNAVGNMYKADEIMTIIKDRVVP